MPSHDLLLHFRRDVTLQLVHRGMDAFAAAQLGHRDLATDAFHQDADLVFGAETPARGLLGFADQTAGGSAERAAPFGGTCGLTSSFMITLPRPRWPAGLDCLRSLRSLRQSN